MLLELKHFLMKDDNTIFVKCFSKCNLFKKSGVVTSYDCAFEFVDQPFVDSTKFDIYLDVLSKLRRYLITFVLLI